MSLSLRGKANDFLIRLITVSNRQQHERKEWGGGREREGLALVVKIEALVESFANPFPCAENERMFTRGRDVKW